MSSRPQRTLSGPHQRMPNGASSHRASPSANLIRRAELASSVRREVRSQVNTSCDASFAWYTPAKLHGSAAHMGRVACAALHQRCVTDALYAYLSIPSNNHRPPDRVGDLRSALRLQYAIRPDADCFSQRHNVRYCRDIRDSIA